MKIILIRHGETVENINRIMQGHMPGKLTNDGITQAKKLGSRLRDERIDAIYSSDLARASDTADEIHEHHKNIPLILTESLREYDLGPYTGKHRKIAEGMDWLKNHPEGVESEEHARSRIKKFIDKTYSKHRKETVCLISHGGISRVIMSVVSGSDIVIDGGLKNTSVSIFEITEDSKNKIHLLNCTKHLE